MDASYISPFIQSIQNVFATMLQLPVQVGEPRVKSSKDSAFDISGIIGMSGDVVGSVVLSFPSSTAERIVALFTGQEMKADSPDFPDAIGELMNMITGGAKARFENRKVSISCPSVIVGPNHMVAQMKDAPCIVIPCNTDCGELVIEVTMQDRKAGATGEKSGALAA